jgi:TctA family transporter
MKIGSPPLVVGLVRGALIEKRLRRSPFPTRGDWTQLVARPPMLALPAPGAAVLVGPLMARDMGRTRPGASVVDVAP